jgi:thioesterase domain-containing protein
VFENPTIGGLAQLITGLVRGENGAESPSTSAFVTYNEEGEKLPLFFFHNDAAGGGMFCRRVAKMLGKSQPLVAIAPHGMGGLPTFTTIEAMARDYADRVRAVQPRGPYRLGGFCAGGLVAFELARIFTQEGERVEPVLLVNSSAPPLRGVLFGDRLLRKIGLNPQLKPSLRVVLCWNIVRLFDAMGKGPKSTLTFIASRFGSLSRRITGAPNSRFNEPEPVNPNPTAEETHSYFANLVAAYTYHPKAYDGEVVFMWGADQPPTSSGPTTGWDRVASQMRLVALPGRHLTPIKEGVDDLGRIIAAECSR